MIPRFKRMFDVKVLEGRGVLLVAEDHDVLLRGHAIEKVAALIDGSRSDREIVAHLDGVLDAVEVYYCLLKLEEEGYVSSRIHNGSSTLETFWHQAELDVPGGFSGLETLTVAISSLADGDVADRFEAGLRSHGVTCAPEGDLHVVLTVSFLHPELARRNETFNRTGQPWLLIKPYGRSVWIGPLFYPGRTGCWACLSQRLEKHRVLQQLAMQESGNFLPESIFSAASTPATRAVGIHLGVIQVLHWLSAGETHALTGTVRTFDVHTYETESHVLTRRPQCTVCGSSERITTSPFPLMLSSQLKAYVSDGGYRTVPPETTYERYKHHVSPITGIVKYVKAVETDSPVIQAYAAGHNLRPVSNRSSDLPAYLRDQSAGKGCTPAQARTSALCEALERYSGIFDGSEHRITASLAELGDKAIHPNDCMHFSPDQYATREAWHRECDHPFQFVPEPFVAEAPREWSPVWSLIHEHERYLPTAYCYYNYEGPLAAQCRPDSNGNAAGNTLEEAILQGLLEVVERDCVSIWWYNRIRRPSVDLNSFSEPFFDRIQAYYRSIHRDVWVIDLTADLPIYTFAAISPRIDRRPEDIVLGFGAHLDAELAIKRALTEMNQLLPFVSSHKEDGSTHYLYEGTLELAWWLTVRVDTSPYLMPDASLPPRTAAHYHKPHHDDLRDDLMFCVSHLSRAGMDVLILDQTRPDIQLPVAKVIIPDMRIFWKRLGAGRLYDLPVELEWLDEPTPESLMNPFPFFL